MMMRSILQDAASLCFSDPNPRDTDLARIGELD